MSAFEYEKITKDQYGHKAYVCYCRECGIRFLVRKRLDHPAICKKCNGYRYNLEHTERMKNKSYQQGYQQGATDMEKAKQIIIDSLIKQLEQIRAEAIDEFVNEIKRIYFDDAKVIRCCELVANEMKENK